MKGTDGGATDSIRIANHVHNFTRNENFIPWPVPFYEY